MDVDAPSDLLRAFADMPDPRAHNTVHSFSNILLIAIDGKTIRRSLDAADDKAAIHMISAFCQQNHRL